MTGLRFKREAALLLAIPFVAIAFWPVAASHIVPLPKLAGAVLLAVSYLLFARPQRLSRPMAIGDVLLCVYAAFAGITLIRAAVSPLPELGLWGLTTRLNGAVFYTVLAIVFWAGRDMALRQAPWVPIYGLVVAGLLTGSYAVLQYAGHDLIAWNTTGYLSSLGNADHTASFHAMVTIAGVWVATDDSRPTAWRVAAGISAALAFTLVCYWAQAEVVQGALLVALVVAALVVAEAVRRGHRTAAVIVVGALVVILAPLVFWAARVDRGVTDRLYLFSAGFRMWAAHPLFGVGLGRVQDFFNQFRLLAELREFGLERAADDLHSVPLQILAMTGLAGGLPYLVFTAIAAFVSGKVLLSPAEEPRSVDRLLAAISLTWIAQSTFSPDSAAISLAGMSSFAVLAGRRLLGVVPEPEGAARTQPWRMVLAAICVIAIGYRVWIDLQFAAVDSRISRMDPMRSQLRSTFETERALKDLVVAVRRYPPDPSVQTRIATSLGSTGHDDEAVGLLLNAAEHNPDDFQAIAILARHYQSVRDVPEARRYVKELTRLEPVNPAAWLQRADLALLAKDLGDAQYSMDSATVLAKKIPVSDRQFWRSVRRLRAVRDSIGGTLAR